MTLYEMYVDMYSDLPTIVPYNMIDVSALSNNACILSRKRNLRLTRMTKTLKSNNPISIVAVVGSKNQHHVNLVLATIA